MAAFSTRTSLAAGLALYALGAFLLAVFLGVAPDRTAAIRDGRAALCEALAIHCSVLVDRNDFKQLEVTLHQIVSRNDEIRSAGIRLADGNLLVEVGDHASQWPNGAGAFSTDRHVHVAIRRGPHEWGWLELQFRPLARVGVWRMTVHPLLPPAVFIGVVSFLGFRSLLGTLQHLEPENVDMRVRAALDMLPEGLLLVDEKNCIVVANATVARWVNQEPEKLKGKRVGELGWSRDYTGTRTNIVPSTKKRDVTPQDKTTIRLQCGGGPERVLWVNCSPVLGKSGSHRGTLISLQEVTRLVRTLPPARAPNALDGKAEAPMWCI